MFVPIIKFFLLISAALVVTVRSPVHSVLLLIFTFCNAAALLLYVHIDFLAFIYVLVYIGAIAVLFLFVVMMLDLRESPIEEEKTNSLSSSLYFIIWVLFGCEFVVSFAGMCFYFYVQPETGLIVALLDPLFSMKAVGIYIYTIAYIALFLVGYILLIAMIGSIVYTLNHARGIRRQDVFEQNARSRITAIRNLD